MKMTIVAYVTYIYCTCCTLLLLNVLKVSLVYQNLIFLQIHIIIYIFTYLLLFTDAGLCPG